MKIPTAAPRRNSYGRPWPRYFLYERLACLLTGRELRERPIEVFLLPDRLRRVLLATLRTPLSADDARHLLNGSPGRIQTSGEPGNSGLGCGQARSRIR
jgi:hypothetical protein